MIRGLLDDLTSMVEIQREAGCRPEEAQRIWQERVEVKESNVVPFRQKH